MNFPHAKYALIVFRWQCNTKTPKRVGWYRECTEEEQTKNEIKSDLISCVEYELYVAI